MSQPLEHIAMLQQCNGSQRDHVRGGFVTGLHHDRTSDGRGFTVELAGRDIVRGEAADQVIAGVVLLAVDQFAYVGGGERARRTRPLLRTPLRMAMQRRHPRRSPRTPQQLQLTTRQRTRRMRRRVPRHPRRMEPNPAVLQRIRHPSLIRVRPPVARRPRTRAPSRRPATRWSRGTPRVRMPPSRVTTAPPPVTNRRPSRRARRRSRRPARLTRARARPPTPRRTQAPQSSGVTSETL